MDTLKLSHRKSEEKWSVMRQKLVLEIEQAQALLSESNDAELRETAIEQLSYFLQVLLGGNLPLRRSTSSGSILSSGKNQSAITTATRQLEAARSDSQALRQKNAQLEGENSRLRRELRSTKDYAERTVGKLERQLGNSKEALQEAEVSEAQTCFFLGGGGGGRGQNLFFCKVSQ